VKAYNLSPFKGLNTWTHHNVNASFFIALPFDLGSLISALFALGAPSDEHRKAVEPAEDPMLWEVSHGSGRFRKQTWKESWSGWTHTHTNSLNVSSNIYV